jgi:hypothetical protein
MTIAIILKTGWGDMPMVHAMPTQLRTLIAASGHPVAKRWLELFDQTRCQEISLSDSDMEKVRGFLKSLGRSV